MHRLLPGRVLALSADLMHCRSELMLRKLSTLSLQTVSAVLLGRCSSWAQPHLARVCAATLGCA